MCCSLRFLLPVMILAITVTALAQSSPRIYPDVGTPLSQAEIQGFDRMIGPEGKELPPGRGTAKEGAEIFARRCAVCHGKNGKRGSCGVW
jgi:cytochrome c